MKEPMSLEKEDLKWATRWPSREQTSSTLRHITSILLCTTVTTSLTARCHVILKDWKRRPCASSKITRSTTIQSNSRKQDSDKKSKHNDNDNYSSSLKRNKLTIDNNSIVLSSCASKNLDDTMHSKTNKNAFKELPANNFMHQCAQGSEVNSSCLLWNRISLLKDEASKESSAEKMFRNPVDYSSEKCGKALSTKLINMHCPQSIKNTTSSTTKAKSRNIQIVKSNTWK